ncbi:cytochrome P450 [Suillus clintonianus]|uniref:cytochrome P450 n=1 Tax=Suillus clintonianus TaxID=1904413 RepID=UPI001B86E1FB|nr:cytochrome P450 [Suillus clintonianus]KAG2153382.1 cytochrome P450 [Suillus clintonianus]
MKLVLSATGCILVVGVVTRAYLHGSKNALPLPPSPPAGSLVGHVLPRDPFLLVKRWIDEYGPLITLRVGIDKIVVIGSHEAAMDIMEKQGIALAERPPSIAAGKLFTGGQAVAFAAGERFRRMRRALHTHLQPKAVEEYQLLQMSHAKITLLSFLEDPGNYQKHVISYAATTITKVVFGKNMNATDDEIELGRQFIGALIAAANPGAYLVDSIPWLQYLPWYGRKLRQQYKSYLKLFTAHLNFVKQEMQNNADAGLSFTRYLLENKQLHGLTETEMAFLSGTFFGAGSDTTALVMCTVLMVAACFPEELAKVTAEIDAVVGTDRAPTFADEHSLPRLRAFIAECMRWRPLGPMGFPHKTTQDVVWKNYCIPAETTVFGNHWAISRDPKAYPDPDAFKPQRWINDEGQMREDLTFFPYGFGRRICPGLHLANRSIFINSVLLFWAFHVTLDDTKPLNDMGYMDGVMPLVPPCSLQFKTRILKTEIRRMLQDYPEGA